MPSARSIGAIIRLPASAVSLKRGPVSYRSECACVCTSTASPWPTSSTVTRKVPIAGSRGTMTKSGAEPDQSERATRNAAGREQPEHTDDPGDGGDRCRGRAAATPPPASRSTIRASARRHANV